MIRARLSTLWRTKNARRTLFSWVASLSIVGLVVGGAIASTGYQAQRIELDDGAVWVSSGAKLAVGRANTHINELNTVLSTESARVDLIQDSVNAFVVNDTKRALEHIDQASGQISDSMPLPAEVTVAVLTPTTIVLHAPTTGEVWLVPVTGVASFDATGPPSFSVGKDSVLVATIEGLIAAVSADTGLVTTLDLLSGGSPQTTQLDGTFGPGSLDITIADKRWVVLDRADARVMTAARSIELASTNEAGAGTGIGNLDEAMLQRPGGHTGVILIGHRGGLAQVNIDNGELGTQASSSRGRPAAPVIVGACAYGAWSSGQVFSQCGNEAAFTDTADGTTASARLVFRVSGASVALNDELSGTSWSVHDGVHRIDNWDDLLAAQETQKLVVQSDTGETPEFETTPLPPVAVNDDMGARPARQTSLPVLLNDYDPNGDALVIDSVTPIAASTGRVQIAPDRTQVMLTLESAATGVVQFDYTISDGRGQSASATVTVTVRTAEENAPPVQARATRADVATGAQVIVNVLGDWVDPDGDAIFLLAAETSVPDTVSFTPAGRVAFTDAGAGGGGERQVSLEVSDGRASGFGVASIQVRAPGTVPIVAETFAVLALAEQPITISPAAHLRGGAGPLSLTGVPAVPGLTISTNFDAFSFTVVSPRVGTTYLSYAVTDGESAATGLVRLDVIEVPDAASRPITAAHSIIVPLQQTRTLDVTASDVDPAGGVLLVTGVVNVPETSGVQVEVVDHRILRITLTKPLDSSVVFGYRVSNGISSAEGSVTVMQAPASTVAQAPIAMPDFASVRVGDVISIPVLKNDIHPGGGLLSLAAELDQNVPTEAGLLFVTGSTLRYLAPTTPGTYSAVYRLNADNGQWASGTVTITVRAVDEATNQAPQPTTVSARVLSGQSVRVQIPLVGIDPDGDSVQFVGLETNPEKGAITSVGGDWFEYEAEPYATGTDVFTYSVVDALGAQASAQVRVGIAEQLAGARNPVAVADEVMARPGYTVYVRALANDSDPDGRPLTITSVTPTDASVSADVVDNIVRVVVPNTPGRYGMVYEISNDVAGTSSNFITVDVRESAPLNRPNVSDAVVSLSDILGQDTVDVNVLDGAFFADGPIASLRPEIVSGYGTTARVLASGARGPGIVRVDVQAQSQVIPFRVAHPGDAAIAAYAFIWVPGTDDALPQRKRGVAPLTVESQQTLSIDLSEYVIAALGKTITLTDVAKVRATHADGSRLVVDDNTLTYTSEDRYFGPASISFEVTDGDSASAPGARTAVIVLPITVTPRENQPPVVVGAQVDIEPGQSKEIDLVKVTRYPYVNDQDELSFTVTGSTDGISAQLDGQKLTVTAQDDAAKGESVALTITVRDLVRLGSPGAVVVRVVPSTRPLAIPAADSVIAPRGDTQTVDVLANDSATNPFPGRPLRVVAVRGLGSANLPAGVVVTPSADRSQLTVTVALSAAPSDTTLEYQVADATDDRDRYTWGTISISVQDVPNAPPAPVRASGFTSGQLTLSWAAPASNNAPITGYIVENDAGYRHECAATVCTLEGLPTGQRSRFSVTATNAIGTSPPSPWSASLSADLVPAAPSTVTLRTISANDSRTAGHPEGGGLIVDWATVANPAGGSPVTSYRVVILEGGGIVSQLDVDAGTTSTPPQWLEAGRAYQARVTSRNDADTGDWQSTTSSTVVALGPPVTNGGFTATQSGSGGQVDLSWNAVSGNGSSTLNYFIAGSASPFGSSSCPANRGTAVTAGTTFTDATTKPSGTYYYALSADNGWSCAVQTRSVLIVIPPVTPGTASYTDARAGDGLLGEDAAFFVDVPTTSAGLAVSVWEALVGTTWVTMTASTAGTPPTTPTFEISRDAFVAAGGVTGQAHSVVIRGCSSPGVCGAQSPSPGTSVDILAPPASP
jgi:hypothetical protein